MELTEKGRYRRWGLDAPALQKLSLLGDRLLGADFNVTSITDPKSVEWVHFLDSLSLLSLKEIAGAKSIVDLGSGAGIPALVLAIARPSRVVAVEAQQKKCAFIRDCVTLMGLDNVEVRCVRAEEYGQEAGREAYDAVVSRALASLPVVAEYSLPLLRLGGAMVAMKGAISNQERIQAQKALDILGGGLLDSTRLDPFPGAQNRWVHVAVKTGMTPKEYPRRVGVPTKRPLGT